MKYDACAAGIVLGVSALGAMGVAAAEPLPDPTRPPPGLAAPEGGGRGSAAAYPANRGLRAVIISPTRRAAIIGGRTVELGGDYGGATLVEVREGSIVLRNHQGRLVSMSLFPGVEIHSRTGGSPVRQKPENADKAQGKQPPAPASGPQAVPISPPAPEEDK